MEVGELAGVPHAALVPDMVAYLRYLILQERPTTARTAGQALGQFAIWCHTKGLEPLKAGRTDLDDYLIWLASEYLTAQGKPLARSTLSTRIANVKAWYAWLMDQGRLVVDPATKLRVRVQRSRVVVREHLSQQEAIALLDTQAELMESAEAGTYTKWIQLRNLAIISLALASGRRISGLASARLEDLDVERCEMRVPREKGARGRVLPLAGWCVAVLAQYIERARHYLAPVDGNPWVFTARDGTGPISHDALRSLLPVLVERTIETNPDLAPELQAKRITWHSLRVTFATVLFSNGCPIRSINELMLHRNLTTTARYTPIDIEDMRSMWDQVHPRP